MVSSKLVRVRGLLQQDRSLAVLLPEAERLRDLDRRLAQLLPAAVARLCRVASLVDGQLTVQCSNGAAATRLRNVSASVQRALATAGTPVERLRVQVRADWSRPERPEKPGMGRAALAAWDELDRELPDSPLRAAVERLVKHQRRA